MTAVSQRKVQADETRERLIDIAWDMVTRGGVGEFTTRKLALRAGVAVGLPFSYFQTREGILDELRLRAWDRLDQIMEPVVEGSRQKNPDDYEGAVRAGIHAVAGFAHREPHVYELIALTPGMEFTEQVMLREVKSAQKFVRHLFEGQKAGVFRFKGDPTVFALALWTSVQGFIQRRSARMEPVFRQYQEQVLEEILDSFFDRVRVKAD